MSPFNSVLALVKGYKKPISAFLIMGGTGLLLEHLFSYNGFDLLDIQGHETYGLIMIAVGVGLSVKWKQWDTLNLKKVKNWWR